MQPEIDALIRVISCDLVDRFTAPTSNADVSCIIVNNRFVRVVLHGFRYTRLDSGYRARSDSDWVKTLRNLQLRLDNSG